MQLTFPRFCGQQLITFALAIGDILDLKAITIDDSNTNGRIAFGAGDIAAVAFTFEASDGASITCEAAPGADLQVKLAARWIASELDRARKLKSAATEAAPPETQARPFKRDEALRIIDRLRNEVGGIKARFPAGLEQEDTTVHGEILFNDKSTIEISFPNSWPLTPQGLHELIDQAKNAKRIRGPQVGNDAGTKPEGTPDAEPKPQG